MARSFFPRLIQMGRAVRFGAHARHSGGLVERCLKGGRFQNRGRGEKVPVAQGRPVADASGENCRAGDDGGIGGLSGTGKIAKRGFPGDARTARHVGKAQTMPVLRMFKIVVYAFFLAQAGNEVQIGFTVLHAVFPFRVVMKAFEGEGVRREILFFQKAPDDFRRALMLENTVVPRLSEKPQAGDDDALVVREMIAPAQILHFPHQTMHRAGLSRSIPDAQQRGRADERCRIFRIRGMQQFHGELIGSADGFLSGKGKD